MTNTTHAAVIRNQFGPRLEEFTDARNFVEAENGLSFDIDHGADLGISNVSVELTGDSYTMIFFFFYSGFRSEVCRLDNLSADDLRVAFIVRTGFFVGL